MTLFVFPLYSQVHKHRAYESSTKYFDNYKQTWTDWSSWVSVNILITIDLENERITIYNQARSHYDIVDSEGYEDKELEAYIMELKTVDQKGVQSMVRLIKYKTGLSQMYLIYNNAIIAYNVRRL